MIRAVRTTTTTMCCILLPSAGLDRCGGTGTGPHKKGYMLRYVGSRTGAIASTLGTQQDNRASTTVPDCQTQLGGRGGTTPPLQVQYSTSQAPKPSDTHALLARAPAAQGACPSRSHIGGNGSLRLLSLPATPAITPTLAPPALSGCARSGPHHERADEEGALEMRIAPSRRLDPNTLAVHCITSHRTRNPNTTRQLDTTYPHLVKSLRPAHVASTSTLTHRAPTLTHTYRHTHAHTHNADTLAHDTESPAPYRTVPDRLPGPPLPFILCSLRLRPTPPQEPPVVVLHPAQLAAPSACAHVRTQ